MARATPARPASTIACASTCATPPIPRLTALRPDHDPRLAAPLRPAGRRAARLRALLAPDGRLLVVENRTAAHFHAPLPEGDFERFSYLVSVLHCLPTALAQQPSAGLGAIVREDTLRELAAEAGFASVEVAPIDHPMVRFYELMTLTRRIRLAYAYG